MDVGSVIGAVFGLFVLVLMVLASAKIEAKKIKRRREIQKEIEETGVEMSQKYELNIDHIEAPEGSSVSVVVRDGVPEIKLSGDAVVQGVTFNGKAIG